MSKPNYRISGLVGPDAAYRRPQAEEQMPVAETPEERREAERFDQAERLVSQAERDQRDERRLRQEAFALNQFFSGGGQELIELFGAEAVSRALRALANEPNVRYENFFNLICQLEPNKQKRGETYQAMVAKAEALAADTEAKREALAINPEATEGDRLQHDRLARDAGRDHVLNVRMTAGASQRLDRTFAPASELDRHHVRAGIQNLIESFQQNPLLLQEVSRHGGDLMKTIYRLDLQARYAHEVRAEALAETLADIREQIEDIRLKTTHDAEATTQTLRFQLDKFARNLQPDADLEANPAFEAVLAATRKAFAEQTSALNAKAAADFKAEARPWAELGRRAEAAQR